MFVKNIVVALAFAAAATATPMEKRTSGKEAQQQCGNNFKPECCNSIVTQIFNLIPISVGQGCTAIDGELIPIDHLPNSFRIANLAVRSPECVAD